MFMTAVQSAITHHVYLIIFSATDPADFLVPVSGSKCKDLAEQLIHKKEFKVIENNTQKKKITKM